MRPRSAIAIAGVLLLGLGLGAVTGIYADQAYPDQLPVIAARGPASGVDQVTFNRALRIIQSNYYNPRPDYSALSHGSIRGLVGGLNDRFSYYLDPSEYQRQLGSYSGKYVGIGVEVNSNGAYPVVDAVFPDSPAARAGILSGDIIVKVDGHDVHNQNPDQTSNLIRGKAGTKVVITVERSGRQLDLVVTREQITIPSVRSTKLEGSVLYVRVYTFGESTASDFDRQLKDGLPGAKAVILDLRDDGGGFIDAAQNIISQFVPDGEAFELRDNTGRVDRHPVSGSPPAPTIPVAVLINANTASASEMVSGSLSVRGRARLVGSPSYGKGSVQQDFPLPDGSDLHITIRRWFLPDGSSVEQKGLTPNLQVKLDTPADMYDVTRPELGHAKDAQLNGALQLLSAAAA